jgi:hypothetical protein
VKLKVNIQEVTITNAGSGKKSWQVAEVVYTSDRGENKNKKIMSFGNPAVFAVLSKQPRGWHNVETEGAPYYNWMTIEAANDAAPSADVVKSGTVSKSTYETAEERKIKQLYIIRQSSVSSALTYWNMVNDRAGQSFVDVDQVLSVAQEFVDFVYGTDQTIENMGAVDSED